MATRPRRDHKPHHGIYSQSKRREEALEKLRKQSKRFDTNRQLQLQAFEQTSERLWARQEEKNLSDVFMDALDLSHSGDDLESLQTSQGVELMQSLWMLEPPDDLAENWLVMARPEGQRCLVEASNGRTVSRLKNGGILHSGISCLPGGSSHLDRQSLLDCIYHEPNDMYYIMDLLCWNGVWIAECATLFRWHWIQTKLAECDTSHQDDTYFKFDAVAFHDGHERGLLSSMYDFVPFIRDGIVLQHKEGCYTHGPNELSLLWKDLTCSRYLIETDMDGIPLEHQIVTLRLSEDEGLYTGDDPPVRFAELQSCSLDHLKHKDQLKPQRLMRFHWHPDMIDGMEMEFVSFVRQRKRPADLMSKVLFQRRAREGNVHSTDLIQAVQRQQGRLFHHA